MERGGRRRAGGAVRAAELNTYYLAVLVVRIMTSSWMVWELTMDIRQGRLATRLLRPLHPLLAYSAEHLAAVPMRALVVSPLVVLVIVWVLDVQLPLADPARLGIFLLSLVGAWLLLFLTMVLIGSLAMFVDSALSVFEIWLGVHFVLSGYLVPIELLPAWAVQADLRPAVLVHARLPGRDRRGPAGRAHRAARAGHPVAVRGGHGWSRRWRSGARACAGSWPSGADVVSVLRRHFDRYLGLLGVQIRTSATLAMQYRLDFLFKGLMAVFWLGVTLVPLLVVFSQRQTRGRLDLARGAGGAGLVLAAQGGAGGQRHPQPDRGGRGRAHRRPGLRAAEAGRRPVPGSAPPASSPGS